MPPVRRIAAWIVPVLGFGAAVHLSSPPAVPADPPADKSEKPYDETVKPFVAKFCFECHNDEKQKGGLTLEGYRAAADARKDRKTWQEVGRMVAAGEMPPKKAKIQPTKEEKESFAAAVESSLTKVECGLAKDPGRVTLRRLNRAEYNNTVRDLCGVDFKPADDFPADDTGYGFDNIGDVLSVQPILIEKYMAAADKVLDAALPPTLDRIPQGKQRFGPQNIGGVFPRSAKFKETNEKGREVQRIVFTQPGPGGYTELRLDKYNFAADGEYLFRVKAWGLKVGDDDPKMTVRLDGKDLKTVTVDVPQAKAKEYEIRTTVKTGERQLSVVFANPYSDPNEEDAKKKHRSLGFESVEIEGPMGGAPRPLTDANRKVLIALPGAGTEKPAAEKVLAAFARKAYRRPVTPDELTRLLRLYTVAADKGEPFENAIRLPLKAVLCSPHFLFRIEDDPKEPNGIRTLNDFELATRLSYFLWSTMPDDELLRLAEKGELRKPGVLAGQVSRMLKDPKSAALVENFAGQWLQLRMIPTLTPDKGTFPQWDDPLKEGMVQETEAYFRYIVKEDRPVLEFLDSNYSFLNDRMARHYGVANVRGPEFRKVTLADGRRGGILTQASILTLTSNPTRTSPVKRGKWILENILGTPPPPPAPDVPELPPVKELKGTLRQQMEQHRANPSCAVCHAKLDPLGFGLENFDGIGAWRETDNKQKIDASGELPGGVNFNGPAELRKILLGKADQFRTCLAEKLLTYALGRGTEYYDRCAIDEVVAKTVKGGDKFSAMVLAVVESDPFQKRRGKRSE
jgi:hypothetical protein